MKILVVVVTFNGKHWMSDCLGNLRESSIPIDVVLVDNQSSDGTVDYVKEYFPEVQFIENRQNLGFGRANNLGLIKALKENYDYVFLLNQDAWIEPDTIKVLVEIHRQHPDYGILSPVHLTKEKTDLDGKFAGFVGRSRENQVLSDLLLRPASLKAVYPIDFVNAAAWLISRACLQKVGGFDPLFPHYGEDNDYIQRAQFHGYTVGFAPKAFIVHDRAGYVKQPDMPRSLPKQYVERLVQLKNIQAALPKTFAFHLKDDIYFAFTSLLEGDWEMFCIKVKLIRKLLAIYPTLRRSRKHSIAAKTAYLAS